MFRRQFLKLLGALPLVALFGLQIPKEDEYVIEVDDFNDVPQGNGPSIVWSGFVRTIYVNSCGSDANDGLTPETPKRTIAAAVEATNDGDTISVWPGTYHEEDKRLNIKGAFLMTGSRIYLGESGTLDLSQASNCFIRDSHFSR